MPDTPSDITPWWDRTHASDSDTLIAYFSMEFAVDAGLPIYSGGLGVLAGDHLKAAADLGIPLVGVGLFYRGGYFTQGLSEAGRQTEDYHPVDPEAAGLVREPVELLLRRLDNVRVRVADVEAAHPAREVDEDVAVEVGDRHSARLRGDDRERERERRGDARRQAVEHLLRARPGDRGLQLDRPRRGHGLERSGGLRIRAWMNREA